MKIEFATEKIELRHNVILSQNKEKKRTSNNSIRPNKARIFNLNIVRFSSFFE